MGLTGEIEARDGSRRSSIDSGSQHRYRRQPPSTRRVQLRRHRRWCRRLFGLKERHLVTDS